MYNSSTLSNHESYQIRVAGRRVGEVVDGVFKKRIQFSRHTLRYPRAICLAVESIELAIRYGADTIEITDGESGSVYVCTIEHFMRHSWEIQRGGFEPQRALIFEKWEVTRPLSIVSNAPKRGEVIRKRGKGPRIRNARFPMAGTESPRQLFFRGML